ncbi:MAG: type ISP restriction/modification enzyme, partial [Rhodanobacteraceae bacterium]
MLRRYAGQRRRLAPLHRPATRRPVRHGEENIERIKRQNRRKISIVIGNPPYNANQANENDNNKNREYPDIDSRIKETYIKASTAQKTKLYDMYARFFRWASDRIAENGVVAFISNRSFIDSRTFDGFRAVITQEFNEIHVVDLGGDVRANPKLSGTKHNVFGIQTGVAIGFLVKRAKTPGCRIFYSRRPELETAEEKLSWLGKAKLGALERSEILPDAKHNWLNLTDNDFDSLIPVASKTAKQAKKASQEKAIFRSYSFGEVTNRDDWVYGESPTEVCEKVSYLVDAYNIDRKRLAGLKDASLAASLGSDIKWTRAVKRDLQNGVAYDFDAARIRSALYRPFVHRLLYFSRQLNEIPNLMP